MALMGNFSKKKKTKSIRAVSLTPTPSWLNPANTTIMENNAVPTPKDETTNSISVTNQFNYAMAVVNGSKKKGHTKSKEIQLHSDQDLSKTPVQSSTKAAKSMTINNTTDIISKEEATTAIKAVTQSNLAMVVVNGSAKNEHIKLEELKSHLDQDLSAIPVHSLTKTDNSNELLRILKEIKNFKPKKQIKSHPHLISGIDVNPRPENEEIELIQPPSRPDQDLSVTPVHSLTKTANSTELLGILKKIKNFKPKEQIKSHLHLISGIDVNPGPENEEIELIQPPSRSDQDLSVISVQSSKKAANTTTMDNKNDLMSRKKTKNSITDTTQSILAMAVINETAKEAHTTAKQLQSQVDQEVSLSLDPFGLNTTNTNELLEILKKIKNFKPKEQIEPHPHFISDIIDNLGSENKEGELKQSPLCVNQEYSKTPVQFLTKPAMPATINNTTSIISKEEATLSISATTPANLAMAIVNGSAKIEHTELDEFKSHLDQDLSATPVQSLTKTAKSVTVNITTNIISKEEATNASSAAMAVINGSAKNEHTTLEELKSHLDQDFSATPVHSIPNSNEFTEILKGVDNFNPIKQIESNPHHISDIIVEPDSDNKEGELKQSPLCVNQEYSKTPVQFLTKPAMPATINNTTSIISKEEATLSISATTPAHLAMAIVNGSAKIDHTELDEFKSHLDQDLSATPVQSLTKTEKSVTVNITTNIISKEEATNASSAAMAVINGSAKNEHTTLEELKSHLDQDFSATPVHSIPNSNEFTKILKGVDNFNPIKPIESNPHHISDIIVEPDSDNKEGELKQSPSLVNEEYSGTPVQSLTNAVDTTATSVTCFESEEETTDPFSASTQTDLAIAAVNGFSEMENTEVEQLQSHTDQEVSLSPGPSWSIPANPNEMSELLSNVSDFIPNDPIEHHPRLLSDINVNPDPANENGEFMQSSSHTDQVSASPANSTNPSKVNTSSQQKQPYVRNEVTRKTVFIGNVDYSVNVMDLLKTFSVCGPINRITILNDYVVSLPRGYAFLEFMNVNSVPYALKLNNSEMNRREITVQLKNTNEYGIRLNRRQEISLIHLTRISMTKMVAMYSSLMFPEQQISIIYYAPIKQNVLMSTSPFPIQQNVQMPMMPFPVQQNVPIPMIPFPVQQNVPMPMIPYSVPNMNYGMYFN